MSGPINQDRQVGFLRPGRILSISLALAGIVDLGFGLYQLFQFFDASLTVVIEIVVGSVLLTTGLVISLMLNYIFGVPQAPLANRPEDSLSRI